MRSTVLVLGGTAEGRRLADTLAARPELRVVSALAGRVSQPRLPAGEVRIGGFDGPDGLAAWLRAERVSAVVDATHPFAARITASAVRAARAVGVPLLVLHRPGWREVAGDRWHWAGSLSEAAELVPPLGRRVLLTTGRQDLGQFAQVRDVWFLVRSIEPPTGPLPVRHEVLLDRGPFTVDGECELLRRNGIDLIVSKDSGGDDAKLVAARQLGVPVLLVRRPALPTAHVVSTVEEAADWVSLSTSE
ncbi:precorrin-6A/cobalt-precorrin-6A reductase [Kutzneria viridogrisea]|uniref:Precorrin-6A/cobalt-precorrin-6A reductase n=1 Tax=Kutzneria viridogrisea TaxID=47990 RepID=A0ABR6BMN3_9PSEU|nr:precorrin-6A/cobalt-precorrin-6A reductase [Kutzneria viridogrisea]